MNDREVAYSLLTILQSYAPDAAAQRELSDTMNTVDSKQAAKVMANMLSDGLNYGNWPWVNFSKV